jgi:hypothetical protein
VDCNLGPKVNWYDHYKLTHFYFIVK